jgi:hypothetical protein
MTMSVARVIKIRPASWKIYVQGDADAQQVRQTLRKMNVETSEPQNEPGLTDPPVVSFLATPASHVPLTRQELEAILLQDGRIELEFEDH